MTPCWLNVPWFLNKSQTLSPAKHPHTITPPPLCFMMGTTRGENPFTVGTKNIIFGLIRPDWHLSSSGFFAAIRPWTPDSHSLLWTVDVEMCLLLELCEAFIWTAIWRAVNSNELLLCSRGNSGSSFPAAVLMRASFIIALDGFYDCTGSNFQSFRIDWPSCLK